jgi:hypothetical protein
MVYFIFLLKPIVKYYAHCNCRVLDYYIFNQYKIIILRTFNRPVQHNHSTEPFNQTIQQNHSTRPFNRTIQPDHSTEPFNQTIQPDHSTRPFNQTIQPDHSTRSLSMFSIILFYTLEINTRFSAKPYYFEKIKGVKCVKSIY